MPLEKRPLLFNDQLFSLTSALITLTSKEMRQKDCKINFWYPYTYYHLFQFKAFLFFGIYHWCHAQEPFETSMQSYWSIRILVCKLSCETKAFTANGPWLKKKMHPFLTVESGNCFKMDSFFWYRRWYCWCHAQKSFETSM